MWLQIVVVVRMRSKGLARYRICRRDDGIPNSPNCEDYLGKGREGEGGKGRKKEEVE